MAANTTHSNNTIKTRIQLKSDTEENWKKSVLTTEGGTKTSGTSFVPLAGELIVYTADSTHPFSRLKIGNGSTNVVRLPFIDSGTLNGNETEIVKKNSYIDFPSPGSSDKLYIDTSTKRIYHYTSANGYTPLSNFEFNVTKSTIGSVIDWKEGVAARATVENNILKLRNGVAPDLSWIERSVVTNVTKQEGDN